MKFLKRSWVMGRSKLMSLSAEAMDVASNKPIQMGTTWSPFTDFKMRMGVFDVGSIAMLAMFTSCNITFFSY
jgi:hypothetical protein